MIIYYYIIIIIIIIIIYIGMMYFVQQGIPQCKGDAAAKAYLSSAMQQLEEVHILVMGGWVWLVMMGGCGL